MALLIQKIVVNLEEIPNTKESKFFFVQFIKSFNQVETLLGEVMYLCS